MKRASVLLLCLVLASSCTVLRPVPRARVDTAFGEVRADHVDDAKHMAVFLEQAVPAVVAMLPGIEVRPVNLYIVASLDRPYLKGATYSDRIEIRADCRGGEELNVIAHELVHTFLGGSWAVLPIVVEEGLATLVELAVSPGVAAETRLHLAMYLATAIAGELEVALPPESPSHGGRRRYSKWVLRSEVDPLVSPAEALELSSGELWKMDDEGTRKLLYAFGYLLVSRIGVERLHELCEEAIALRLDTVPGAWLFEAAGLPAEDPTRWMEAVRSLIGPEELALLESHAVHAERANERSFSLH